MSVMKQSRYVIGMLGSDLNIFVTYYIYNYIYIYIPTPQMTDWFTPLAHAQRVIISCLFRIHTCYTTDTLC